MKEVGKIGLVWSGLAVAIFLGLVVLIEVVLGGTVRDAGLVLIILVSTVPTLFLSMYICGKKKKAD